MEWRVAPSYQTWTIVSVDEIARKADVEEQCWKCGGSGYYYIFGPCFACNGTGKIRKRVKAYTPDEYEKYVATQERAKERKEEKKAEERATAEAQAEATKAVYLAENGYDVECPQVCLVFGENTFTAKDELKELGCKYRPELGWYHTHPVDIPVGCGMVGVPFDEIFDWNCYYKKAVLKENAKEIADAARTSAMPKSNSDYLGEIKERLRDLQAIFVNARTIDTKFGTSILYTFKVGDDVLAWFCSGKGIDPEIKEGDAIFLTGTVKKHEEYNGVKQTYLNRCVVVKREG